MARCLSFFGMHCALALFMCVANLAGAESSLIDSENDVDSCEYVGSVFKTGGVVTMPAALSCLYSFPFNASLASAIADSVYNTYLFHTYSDISRDSPTKEFPMQVDVLGSLTEIKSRVFENDFAFNEAVFSLITALNDGHAVYYPYCYVYSMASYTAFPLVKIMGSSGMSEVVQISSLAGTLFPTVVGATEAALGINVASYAKATLLEINGQDPIAYIAKFAEGLGVYKDINARINQAYLRITADGVVHVGAMMGSNIMAAPKAADITYTLRKAGSSTVETLTIPYFVSLRPTAQLFSNASDFFAKNCLATPIRSAVASSSPAAKRSRGRAKRGVMADSDAHSLKVGKPDVVTEQQRLGDGPGAMRTLVDSFIKSFLLGDGITGVMYAPNMEGPDGDFEQWSLDVYNGIKAIKEAGGTRLIIDVQENGGGYVVLAYELFEYLFPEVSEPQYPIQNPVPPLAKIMAERSIQDLEKSRSVFESPCQYSWFGNQDEHANVYYNGDDFFFPLQSRTYGGATSNFSSLYSFIDRNTPPYGSNTLDLLISPIGDVEPKFRKSDVLILSNGACYSTCSIFAYVMQEFGVKVVAVGGALESPMAYSAGSVGYSYSLEDLIYAEVEYLNLTSHPQAPKPLPVQAYVGLSCAQAFCPESDTIPADFIFKAADYRFAFNEDTVDNVEELYKETASYFPKAEGNVGHVKSHIAQPAGFSGGFGRSVVR